MLRSKQGLIQEFFSDKRYYSRILGLCKRLHKDAQDGEDAAHDIYMLFMQHADSYNFPEDKEAAFFYVQQAIRNQWRMKKRKAGIVPERLNDDLLLIADERSLTYMQKLEKVNAIVLANSHRFTPDQLKLWQCMAELRTLEEMETLLGKERTTLYSLRNKLVNKIRNLVQYDELN